MGSEEFGVDLKRLNNEFETMTITCGDVCTDEVENRSWISNETEVV